MYNFLRLKLWGHWTDSHEFFLHDAEALSPLLLRAFTMRYSIPFRNTRAKSKRGQFQRLQKALKINWATAKLMLI